MHPQVGILKAFTPVITVDAPEKGKSTWKQRLAAGIVMATCFWLLYKQTDVDLMKEEALKVHDSILEYLVRVLRSAEVACADPGFPTARRTWLGKGNSISKARPRGCHPRRLRNLLRDSL